MSGLRVNSTDQVSAFPFLAFDSNTLDGLQSETAAAITKASLFSHSLVITAFISKAFSIFKVWTPTKSGNAVGAVTRVTDAPLFLAASEIAYPIFPEERFPIVRTGSIASCVPPALTTIFLPLKSPSFPRTIDIIPRRSGISTSLPVPNIPEASLPFSGPAMNMPLETNLDMFS